jgi:shikimate kinase
MNGALMAPFVVMVTKNHNVFLIGLMAVGKSTVGRLLSDELGLPFFDTDRVVEEKAGADIAWIFDMEGEVGFRERECQAVDELTQRDGVVLATGGGVVLREENRRNLSARGIVVFLDSPIDRLVERTRRDKRRPLLRQGDARATRTPAQERAPLYVSIADYRFCADRHSAKALAREIADHLRRDGCFV